MAAAAKNVLPDYMEKLRALREDNDYTQERIARYLGTSQTMYARYERGANELPVRHFIMLCKLYEVSSDYLLGLKDLARTREEIWKKSKNNAGKL